ncbi:hypothetical protein [Desulforamulus aeronauticus]|uniref:Uncharacterized protein n=1 Tax=Desulforamulus aeronauticus DSM 10349 TaxID=1121421 RepID=A0A1M6RN00_9FIRM|nr:hypothetical protein [Desulforamulus aeronauticus]SHK33816.1 hypothetical protein SAMN02745123_01531 [Desulforamulus aeronauticus DSM 10349]
MRKPMAPQIDEKALSKRYRTSVSKIIKLWKSGRNDMEVASLTGLDQFTLRQIKSDIELAYRRTRLEKKKEALARNQASLNHILLRPPW